MKKKERFETSLFSSTWIWTKTKHNQNSQQQYNKSIIKCKLK